MRSMLAFASLITAVLALAAVAEEPVYFADENLKLAVEEELWIDDPSPSEMLWLTSLDANARGITDLTGLEYAQNLSTLQCTHNQIASLAPVATLTSLRKLIPNNNQITDISCLAALVNLEHLDIHENKLSDISVLAGLTNLQFLNLHDNQVRDISVLSRLDKLVFLYLELNQIADMSPVAGLTHLEQLTVQDNHIVQVPDLSQLTRLEVLDLSGNQIQDLSSLLGLTHLRELFLHGNPLNTQAYCSQLYSIAANNAGAQLFYDPNPAPPQVSASDGSQAYVEILWNQICNGPAYTSYYRVFRASPGGNTKTAVSPWQTSLRFADAGAAPGVELTYWVQVATSATGLNAGPFSAPDTGWRKLALMISSTPGGSVTLPGEGTFLYSVGENAPVTAEPADPNLYSFLGWTGTAVDAGKVGDASRSSTAVLIDGDYTLQAHFAACMSTIYVDDNAPADPGPGDPARNDPNESGTPEHPFDTIQEAIDVAVGGLSVVVRPGTYGESIDLKGKDIRITGLDPENPCAAYPVICGCGKGPVVTFARGEGPDCVLDGFEITGGNGGPAGAIDCRGSSPVIMHCLVVGNRSAAQGGAIYCIDSNAVFADCTIADNVGPDSSAGVRLVDSNAVLVNTIIWGNTPHEVLADGNSVPSIQYCDVRGAWPGLGNIDDDPLFARRGQFDPNDTPDNPQDDIWLGGDYHLKSQAGRWNPAAATWVQDDPTSPCIDAGDPTSPVAHEPPPNGNRINLGAYGGTAQASTSP